MRSAIPKTPAYAFRKDHERIGVESFTSTLISLGLLTEIVTRFVCAQTTLPLNKLNKKTRRDFDKEFVYNRLQFTSMLTRALQNHGANLKRGLGLLLVIFILFGTTVEAAHRHGVAAAQSNSVASVTNPNSGASSTSKAKPGCSDCLLCQLHQNLSATLISIKLTAAPLVRVTHAHKFDPVSISSTPYSLQSGRAPPQAN